MNNLIPTTTSFSVAAKNVYDITTSLISTRKQNKLIKAGQLRQLEIAIYSANKAYGQSCMHGLMNSSREYLIDSYNQISKYLNTDFGDMLLEMLRSELNYYKGYCDDFNRLIRLGDFE